MSLELVVQDGLQTGRRIVVTGAPVTLGRSTRAMVVFAGDTFMSGVHVRVSAVTGGVALTDLQSTNGTFLNSRRITQALAVVGDLIKIGSLHLRVAERGMPVSAHEGTGQGATVFSSPPLTSRPIQALAVPPPIVSGGPQRATADAVLALLTSSGAPLYALVDAAADPVIQSLLLVGAETNLVQCLYGGDSATTLASWAPYLVALSPESQLLRALLDQGWGKAWASYFTTGASFDDLRKHFRKFLMVQLEQGQQVYFRFYDPRVLRDFLPTANSAELATFFGPVDAWLLEAEGSRALLYLRNTSDGLSSEVVPLTDGGGLTQSMRMIRNT